MEFDWMYEVLMAAKTDAQYLACLGEVSRLEPAFLEIRSALSQEKQVLLDRYIAACETLDDSLLAIAFRTGRNP